MLYTKFAFAPSFSASASISLNATPTAARSRSGYSDPARFGLSTARHSGSGPPGKMVIGDDDIDARFAQRADGLERARAAVARDDEAGAGFARGTYARLAQVVAVLQTSRDERNGTRAEVAQRSREERRGADAIDVVVAVNEHRLGVADRAHEPFDGDGRVRQRVR